MCTCDVMACLAEVLLTVGICVAICVHPGCCSLWADWWDYNGISGPQFWGVINPRWTLCSKGRNQSPIDIDPSSLLFDPSLAPLYFQGDEPNENYSKDAAWTSAESVLAFQCRQTEKPRKRFELYEVPVAKFKDFVQLSLHIGSMGKLSGTLQNNGHDVMFYVNHSSQSMRQMTVTSGPLSYTFRVDRIRFHFGRNENESGSEHTVGGKAFPVELQVLAFNCDLYPDFKTAEQSPHGLLAIAIFARLSTVGHREFDVLQKAFGSTIFKGDWTPLPKLKLRRLMPSTDHYVTYQGSLTYPGCHETVTWLIFNRPVYISPSQLATLQTLRQDTRNNPVMLMGGSIRPLQQLHQRTVRTNINFKEKKCSMARTAVYQVNEYLAGRDPR